MQTANGLVIPDIQSLTELDLQIKSLQEKKKALKSQPKEFKPSAVVSEFKGHKTLELSPRPGATVYDGKFSFGASKARLILALIPEIKKFLDENPVGK